MPKKKKSQRGLFDIPAQYSCPHCDNNIEIPLPLLATGGCDVICRTCARELHLNEETLRRIFEQHGKRVEAIRRAAPKQE